MRLLSTWRCCARVGSGSLAGRDPVGIHDPPADAAVHAPGEGVVTCRAVSRSRCGGWPGRRRMLLADQRRMRWPLGDRPILSGATALDVALAWDSAVGWGGVVVGVLPVLDRPSGVAGVGQNRGDGSHHPALASTMLVSVGVGARWAGDVVVVEIAGDPGDAAATKPLREDPQHVQCGRRVGFQAVQPPAPGLARRGRSRGHEW